MKNSIIDISNEMLLQPYASGFKLIRPDKYINNGLSPILWSMRELDHFPLNVYFLDKNSTILNINEDCISTCGYPSLKKSIGKTRHLIAKKEVVDIITQEDLKVVKENRPYVFEENFILLDEIGFPAIALKAPLYNDENKVIGLFGCSMKLNKLDTARMLQSITLLLKLSLMIKPFNDNMYLQQLLGNFYTSPKSKAFLSRRESECLRLIGEGKTAKMIARYLSLSPRTIEHYIESIKIKTNIFSKADLIAYANNS